MKVILVIMLVRGLGPLPISTTEIQVASNQTIEQAMGICIQDGENIQFAYAKAGEVTSYTCSVQITR